MTGIKFTGDFYAKSPEEFKKIKIAALAAGYKGVEMTNGSKEGKSGAGQFLTLQAPRYERKGKCGYCNSLISVYGIYGHGRKCENCGKTIYQKYEKGGLITFFFRDFKEGAFDGLFMDVTMRIHSFDIDKHILRLDSVIPQYAKYGKQKRKKVQEIIDKNSHAYVKHKIGNKTVYSFYYPFNGMMNELTQINTTEVKNRKGGYPSGPRNCSVVQILDGKEYSEHASFSGMFAELPMPTSFHIYRDWKVKKTASELARRAGITSRPEYYSGRPAGDITAKHLTKLHNLIKEHISTEAAGEFVKMIEGTNDMAATILMRKYNILEANKWKWDSKYDDKGEPEKKINNIQLDIDNPMQMYASILSVMGSGRGIMKTMEDFGIISTGFDTHSSSIKSEFLNSISNGSESKESN